MAKIGTAHVEIKPVVNEDELAKIAEEVAAAVEAGVRVGMQRGVERGQQVSDRA